MLDANVVYCNYYYDAVVQNTVPINNNYKGRRWGPLFAGELWGALGVFLAPGMIQTVLKKAATR